MNLLFLHNHVIEFDRIKKARLNFMKIKLVADSSANLFSMDGMDFASVPMRVRAGEKEYIDDQQLDIPLMLKELAAYNGKSGSACPGTGEWMDAFGDADVVFGVAITSGLSGCYNAGATAGEQYEAEHPGRRVFILDSLSTGPEMELILEKYKELANADQSFDEMKNHIQEYCKHTHLLFSLESLDNFAKNGRVSVATAKIAGLLGIRIVGRASDEGTLEPLHKCRGEHSALKKILSCMKESGYCGGKVRLSHTYNPEAAEALKNMITEEYPDADISIRENHGLCCYYAEVGGVLVGFEG